MIQVQLDQGMQRLCWLYLDITLPLHERIQSVTVRPSANDPPGARGARRLGRQVRRSARVATCQLFALRSPHDLQPR